MQARESLLQAGELQVRWLKQVLWLVTALVSRLQLYKPVQSPTCIKPLDVHTGITDLHELPLHGYNVSPSYLIKTKYQKKYPKGPMNANRSILGML